MDEYAKAGGFWLSLPAPRSEPQSEIQPGRVGCISMVMLVSGVIAIAFTMFCCATGAETHSRPLSS